MDDLGFVRRCVSGDKRAWDEFVEKYSSLIYNYIHSVSRAKAHTFTQENIQDIFQEIFLSLIKDNYRKLSTFQAKNGCSLASWLRQVTINTTLNYIRRLKPNISIDEQVNGDIKLIDILSSDFPSAADTLSQDEKLNSLKDCIGKLNIDDKYFLELYIHRNLGLEELKDHLKVSRGAIDMRKSRIVERLKECFKGKGFTIIN